ncbi:MAG TPA: spermidine/putrescine ABC transporter permease [Anaerolineae bacterium]|nr:spermidine/putrescine ABC transporter permease [Anaerolineae bacterium]HCK65429.1 spermidine/putrescine ABC transporter permease [Anaerolineae bacterium]
MLKFFRGKSNWQLFGLLSPGALWILIFFNLPILIVMFISFVERGRAGGIQIPPVYTLENYSQLFNACVSEFAGPECDPFLYIGIFGNSVRIALIVTFWCIILGYPLSYFISKQKPVWRDALMILVIIPFWTNFLVRTYALKQVLAAEGLLNSFLMGIGIIGQPLDLLFNEFAVVVGLIYGYLPFAVLPMYASIEKFDYSLMEAASDLGAPPQRAFWRVMLPMTLPGIFAALVLVFVPVVGAFITPDIMGGGKVEMIGTLINRQFGVARNWPFGSSMSLILMLLVLIGVIFYFRSSTEETRRAM